MDISIVKLNYLNIKVLMRLLILFNGCHLRHVSFSVGVASNSKVGSHPYICMDICMVKFDYLNIMELLILVNHCTHG